MQNSAGGETQSALEARYKRIIKYRKHRRGFREVPLYSVGHQLGKDRFPRRDTNIYNSNNAGPEQPPKINKWRNNLTAVSQRYNLYVLACLDTLYGYQPEFPSQALPNEPLFKWRLPVTEAGAQIPGHFFQGHNQPHSSHSVNNMLIADLGEREVLVCVCDDGDVVAVFTDSLCSSENFNPVPFLHDNVGKSAWGLSVHAEARLIAVSANSLLVTVYAPALIMNTDFADNVPIPKCEFVPPIPGSSWNLIKSVEDLCPGQPQGSKAARGALIFRYNRAYNFKFVFKGHLHNIPCVSFCNTGDDPEGRYLASTDLAGRSFIWDIYKGAYVRAIAPNDNFGRPGASDHLYQHIYGWGIHFLDPKIFAPTKSIVEALGVCHKVSMWPRGHVTSPAAEIFDISESQLKVQNSCLRWNIDGRQTNSSTIDPSLTSLSDVNGLDVDLQPDQETSESEATGMLDAESSEDEDDDEEEQEIGAAKFHRGPITCRNQSALRENKKGRILEDQLGFELIGQLSYLRWTMFFHSAECAKSAPDPHIKSRLNSPLILINPRKIYLLQSSDLHFYSSVDGNAPDPVVMLDDPLEQAAPSMISATLDHHDRMNLWASIRELGVLLVGSPKGRVAVLSLHLLLPDRDPGIEEPKTAIHEEMYTMRLDHILPFQDEEEAQLRPLQPLAGIAAGPIHTQQPPGKQRYRIFLTYSNHTVLAYEIGREGSDRYGDIMIS